MWTRPPQTDNIVRQDVLLEIIIRLLLIVAFFAVHFNISPYQRHLTESEILTFYKRPRRDSYVPSWLCIVIITGVPLLLVIIPCLFTKTYPYIDMLQTLLAWTLALSINAFLTETIKVVVGRPRPDFFYRCFPNGIVTKGLQCTGDIREVKEGLKSFPSGHSSFSFCSLGFLSIWLCGRLGVISRNRGDTLRLLLCISPLVLALGIGVSRCCDNHHHWEDVVAGSVMGLVLTYACYHQYYCPLDSHMSGTPHLRRIIVDYDVPIIDECCTQDLDIIDMKTNLLSFSKRCNNYVN